MTKKKSKGKNKSSDKGKKQRDKRADNGVAEIADAETKLVEALANLEAARQELARRERDLSTLLARHGRLPEAQPAAVPLFDQQQTLTETNAGVMADGGGGLIVATADDQSPDEEW